MTTQPKSPARETVERISVSLPPGLVAELDELVEERDFGNRSQAVAWMIRESLLESSRASGDAVMAGTVTLFFRQTRPGILEELAELKRRCVDEVIGSLQVQLMDGHLMEVILVQGPAAKLQDFTDKLVATKGVKAGRLTLTTNIIPPLHPLPKKSQ
ncbi:MAG: CopG family ribbon-helix-helix protein [Terrimicrobiaceae bacterium]